MEFISLLTAILTAINVAATIAYVITTIFIARFTRTHLQKFTEFEEARTRPYVLFNIISTSDRVNQSHIKNYGLSAAFDVQVSLSPDLKVFDSEDLDTLSSNAISMMPPEYEIVSDLNSGPGFYERYPEPIFNGSISYKNSKGIEFKETIHIDLTFMKRKFSHDDDSVASEIKNLSKHVERISDDFRRLQQKG